MPMPTREITEPFKNQLARLTPEQYAAFIAALQDFIADCDSGHFRASLRVHKLSDKDVWSMSWSGDGRATFRFGKPIHTGKRHIIWLSIGTHAIYQD
jgi:hypothetical protein